MRASPQELAKIMNPRELVILCLGLAIVAVVLRGLYVALRARRGQLRLAIDKNIPQDIDLDALELAELPGGGARVVARNLEAVNRQNSAVESANARAASIALGKKPAVTDAVPVLMDPVEIRDIEPAGRADEAVAEEDPDAILFDYADANARSNPVSDSARSSESDSSSRTAIDTMSQVAPDYDDDDYEDYDEDEEEFDDYDDESLDDEDDYDDDHSEDDYDEDEDDFDEESEDPDEDFDDDDDYDSDLDEIDDDDSDYDEDLDFENDEDLDDFSMTAGERIGFSEPSRPSQSAASEAVNADDEAKPGRTEKQRRPLFAAFGRALKAKDVEPEREPEIAVAQPQPQTRLQPRPQIQPQIQPQAKQSSSRPVPITAQQQRRNRTDETSAPAETMQVPKNAPEYVATEPSEVVVLNVMSKLGRQFAGDDLLHALITSGMKFGDMNIFHRRLAGESKGPVIFSAANILNPGVFDLNRMHEFTTLGISLFLALPTPINNLEAFTQMLDAARKLGDALDGELRDDNRNLMTAQTIEHYRQRIRDFELRRLKAVGTRG